MEEMTVKSFRLNDEYQDVVEDIMKARQFRFFADAIRFGLDLAFKELKKNKKESEKSQLVFVEADKINETERALEFKLAGKLTNEQLKDYKENYERDDISIANYCKNKNLLQEYL